MGRKKRKPVSATTKHAANGVKSDAEPLSAWESAKSRGNTLYSQGQYHQAQEEYSTAIMYLQLDLCAEGLSR